MSPLSLLRPPAVAGVMRAFRPSSRTVGTEMRQALLEQAGRRIGPLRAERSDLYRALETAGGAGWPGTAVMDAVIDRLISEGLWAELHRPAA